MAEVPDTRYTRTDDGLALAYQTLGSGPTDVVLIPSNFAVDLMWDEPSYAHALHRLAGLGRLISLDYRGHGGSDPVPLGALPTPETWMEDTRVVMDAVGSSAAHIICHGATFLGLLFAATHPERTRTLTLVDPTARIVEDDDYPCGVPQDVLDAFVDWDIRTYGTPEHVSLYAPSRSRDQEFIRWQGRMERAGSSPVAHAALVRWLVALDTRAVLPTIHVPTLVITRRDGRMASVEQARYVAEHIPGAKFVDLPGSDYWLFSESPDLLVDQISEFITGVKPVGSQDRVLAAILFTDIVGSTAHASRLGDREWSRLLDQHDGIVARELSLYRGRKVNPTGDGLLATFDGPARAVRCAQAIIEEVRPLGVDVRAGVHTGEVELRGDDIGGIAVHVGQRISGLAAPGEVLVSRTVTDLVAGSGLAFTDRGEHSLRGVSGTWHLYSVIA